MNNKSDPALESDMGKSQKTEDNPSGDSLNTPKESPVEKSENEKGVHEQYSFIRETIKEDRNSKILTRRSVTRTLVHAMIFGAVACLAFFMLSPRIAGFFYEEEVREPEPIIIHIPFEPEEPEEEEIEEEPEEPEELEGNELEDEEIEEPEPIQLTVESYQEILDSLQEITVEANKSIAYIEGFDGAIDLIEEERLRANRITGLVAGDNGSELIIIAYNGLVDRFSYFRAIMADGKPRSARLVTQDNTRRLAVFAVAIDELDEEALEQIEVARWGNSNRARSGELVIAIGNMLGYGDGQTHGILTSNQSFEIITDGRFRMLGTDILATPGGTGVLFNKNGMVIGLLMPGSWQREGSITANFIGISDLTRVIPLLVEGDGVPYLGVEGITITEELSYILEIPVGVYVRSLTTDSPAMRARIQNGDVIVGFNDSEINTKQDLVNGIFSNEEGIPLEVRIKRRGAEGYVEMDFPVIIERR
jgi:serine protease Do